MQPANILISFLSMLVIFFVIMRGRKRYKCLEDEFKRSMEKQNRSLMATEKQFHDSHLSQLADHCRELEAKVQNRARILEILIAELDEKLEKIKREKNNY
jgi:hypothetical protein